MMSILAATIGLQVTSQYLTCHSQTGATPTAIMEVVPEAAW